MCIQMQFLRIQGLNHMISNKDNNIKVLQTGIILEAGQVQWLFSTDYTNVSTYISLCDLSLHLSNLAAHMLVLPLDVRRFIPEI